METRILIVDDDPFICRQLEELYSSQQYAVSSAPNAPEALRLLQEHEFSLAVVDLKIPGTDGIGLTREIRDRWPDLDVIMITGYASIKGAACPDTLLESELFGYERGAFTGAVHDRVGKIELSTAGTLFLDEIESISLNMQLKLLRVLEEREVEKLGSNRRIKVNMRIITATNMELAQAVAEGRMREDFYYRINVVPIRIPPLRERIEDIPLLVGEFLRNSEMAREKGINRVSNKALSQLMSYTWPGNVRELGNVIERAILRTSGAVIREVDLPGHSS